MSRYIIETAATDEEIVAALRGEGYFPLIQPLPENPALLAEAAPALLSLLTELYDYCHNSVAYFGASDDETRDLSDRIGAALQRLPSQPVPAQARLEQIARWIDEFDKLTSESEYTDVGDAWELFRDIRSLARGES